MASVTITPKSTSPKVKFAHAFAYGIFNATGIRAGTATFSEVLPFRIRITNIGIPSYTSNQPAGIGIAIIGLNNYIL